MIDRFAAMKALSAYNENDKTCHYSDNLNAKPLVIDCNTDTNDSFSGLESEEDSRMHAREGKLTESGNELQDLVLVKKERRRQRNKLSAQSYRQRRREQTSTAQKTLESLEAHNKFLLEKVRHLEAEKHIVEEYLRSCVKVPCRPYLSPCHPPLGASACPTIPETDSCSPESTTSCPTANSQSFSAAFTSGAIGGAEGGADDDNGNYTPNARCCDNENNNNLNVNLKAPRKMSFVNNNMPLSMSQVSMETEANNMLVK